MEDEKTVRSQKKIREDVNVAAHLEEVEKKGEEKDRTPKRFLSRTDILAYKDLRREPVWIPEWDGHVYVRMLTAKERDEIQAIWNKGTDEEKDTILPEFRYTVIRMTAVDEEGDPLFTKADVEELEKKSAVALERILDAALAISKMKRDSLEKEVGNSSEGQSGGSPTV